MAVPTSGDYGDDSQVKSLAGVRQALTKYDEVIKLGIESGNRYLEDSLFPVVLTLPLTTDQLRSATFIVNYDAVLQLKLHLHADKAECDKWEARRDKALNKLKEKIEAQPSQSGKAQTFIAKSKYRSLKLRNLNPL